MAYYKSKKPTKDGRSWYFVSYKNKKQYKSKKYKTKKEAKDKEALFRMQRDNPYNKKFGLVWMDYISELEKIKKESTIYTYKKDYNKHIRDFFEEKNINALTVQDIRKWAEKMENKKLSVKYMNKIHNILNCIFDFAIKNYNLPTNPSRVFGPFKEKNDVIKDDRNKLRYITKEQFDKFIAIIDDNMWKTWFITCWFTGCRKGELQALTWNDIDFNSNNIYINKTLSVKTDKKYKITSTKNNTNRIVGMNKELRKTLLIYKEEKQKYKDFKNTWFVFGDVNYLPQTTIDRYKDKYFSLVPDIPRITNHEFRHSIITYLINSYIENCRNNNVNIDTDRFFIMLAKRDGHSVETLKRNYLHLFPTIQNEIIDLLDS